MIKNDGLKILQNINCKSTNIKSILKPIGIILMLILSIILVMQYTDYKDKKAIYDLFDNNVCTQRDEVKRIKQNVAELPQPVLNVLLNNNVHIIFQCLSIKDDCSGTYNTKSKRITIKYIVDKDGDMMSSNEMNITTLHEIGHAINSNRNNTTAYNYTANNVFDDIYKQESGNLFNIDTFPSRDLWIQYYLNDREEYFVECFAFYYCNNETNELLKEKAPKTYDYIKQTIDDYKEYTFKDYLKEEIFGL